MNPIYFVEIDLGGGSYWRMTSWDEDLTLDGSLYSSKPLRVSGLSEKQEVRPPEINLEIDNVDLASREINPENLLDCQVNLTLAFEERLHDSSTFLNFFFWAEAVAFDETRIELSLTNRMELLGIEIPRFRFSRLCRWVFKGDECRYKGTETFCDKTRETCINTMNNFQNFGGFPSVPKRPLI